MRLLSLLLVPALFLLVAAEDAKTPKDKLQGAWKVTKATKRGKDAPPELVNNMTVSFKDDTVTVGDGKRNEIADFKLNPNTKPGSIDISPKGDGKTVMGIYELNGDDLKLCWRKSGAERPEKFESTEENNAFLLILKRKK